jgi:hypothetical protein
MIVNASWGEIAGAFTAMALLVLFGRIMLALFVDERALHWTERWAASLLVGSAGVSLTVLWCGPLFDLVPVRWVVCLLMLGAGVLARHRRRRLPRLDASIPPEEIGWVDLALSAGIALQGLALLTMALQTSLGWDGLMNYEIKARILLDNQPSGRFPLSYLSDQSRVWSHQGYPLLVPLTEFWVYRWVGGAHQTLVKLLFPAFYLSLAGFLYGALRRTGGRRIALAGCLALGFVPSLAVGSGAAIYGYCDVPLAAAVLGSSAFAARGLRTGARRDFVMAALLSSSAVWTKREGVLFAAYLAIAVILIQWLRARREGEWIGPGLLTTGWLALGPAVVIAPWWALLAWHGVPDPDFVGFSVEHLRANLDRVPVIAASLARELVRPGHWGLLWPAFGLGLLASAPRVRDEAEWLVPGAVILAMGAYGCSFIFSAWTPFTEHVGTALPRLLIPLAPLALLALFSAVRNPNGSNLLLHLDGTAPGNDIPAGPVPRNGLLLGS